jgi:hypothetical protein
MKSVAVNIAVHMNGWCVKLLKAQATRLCLIVPVALISVANASENVPHRPFAQWADVPAKGEFVAGAVYEQSDAYDIWASGQHVSLPDSASGIHVNQGYFALQYGLTERWAADFNVGYTKETYQASPSVSQQSNSGIMDWSFGVRYQLCNEAWDQSAWLPTATFRAGAVMPGTFDQHFPFSPGLRASAIEPELLLRKHFAWQGFGSYGDGLYRWNRTTGNDQYIIAVGVFQQFKQWELDLGYRHLQTIAGSDITIAADNTISYPRDARENNDSLEAGVSYTTSRRRNRYGGQIRKVFDGNNSDEKFWFGFSVDFPFGGKTATEELTP